MLRTLTIATLLALGVTAAHAEDASTNVVYGDLDLSQPAGAKILASRLQDAALSVCMKANPENISHGNLRNCVDMSVSMAMARIESDLDQAVRAKLTNVRVAMEGP